MKDNPKIEKYTVNMFTMSYSHSHNLNNFET
jgi:hypothetical protein